MTLERYVIVYFTSKPRSDYLARWEGAQINGQNSIMFPNATVLTFEKTYVLSGDSSSKMVSIEKDTVKGIEDSYQ